MSGYISNSGIIDAIENLVKKSTGQLYIISPYTETSPLLRKLLIHFDNKFQNADFKFVYRKINDPSELEFWRSLKHVKIYQWDNFHTKSYMNQDTIINATMNLHKYSQLHNIESGHIYTKDDPNYYKALEDIDIILGQCEPIDHDNIKIGKPIEHVASTKKDGFCIRCRRPIKKDFSKPYCIPCLNQWRENQGGDVYNQEHYCHDCGVEAHTSWKYPRCPPCAEVSFREYQQHGHAAGTL